MSFRGNQNRNRNFGGNNYGGPMGASRLGNMNMSPWDTQNSSGNFGGGNMRQGGGQGMNAQAINLANNLLTNLFRNQNPPSLLDLPRGGGGMGNRNQRGGPMVNRGGPGNRLNNRRVQGGFQNRGVVGAKSAQKQGSGGIRKQNAFDRAKKLLAKNATNKKKDSASGEKKTESKESPYASVPNDMFYCHLCKKHMWDANSFENHIKGRTHLMMREGIEESYRLKANMIRQEAKIAEQLKSIELDRLKRMGKTKQRMLEYCTMCDLNFHGHISAHRKSEGHLQLKKFLHPKCVECNKEFATRIDYDSHLLSADHLKKAAEKNTKVGERKRATLTIHTEEEELKDIRPPQKKRKRPITKKTDEAGVEVKKEPGEDGDEGEEANTEGGDSATTVATGVNIKKEPTGSEDAEETKEGDELNETAEEEEVALPVDPDDCILDYAESDEIPAEVDNRLPKYNWTRPVGNGLITKIECYECALCNKFFDTEKTIEIHARTVTHHRNFLKFINERSNDTKIAQKRAAAAMEESERKRRKLEEVEAGPSAEGETDECNNGDEAHAGDHEAEGEGHIDGDGEGDADGDGDGEEGDGGNGELYDPSEATGDDEDIEMDENGVDDEEQGDDSDQDHDEEMDNIDQQQQQQQQSSEPVKSESEPQQQQQQQQQAESKPPSKVAAPAASIAAATPAPATNNQSNTNVANKNIMSGGNQNSVNNANNSNNNSAPPTTPASNANDVGNNSTPMKKMTPGGGGGGRGGGKGTPRGRGRGRYNRY